MAKSRVELQAERMAGNVFLDVDPSALNDIVSRHRDGLISESDAISQLKSMQGDIASRLIGFDGRKIPAEWNEIGLAIEKSEQRYLLKERQQFYIGTFSLPIAILFVLLSFLFGWQHSEGAVAVSGLLGAGLASLAAHAYFVLRVHQQASIAAERLAEKRLGVLFLKLALSATGEERQSLLGAGTSMFLGHQAPETLPLSPEDMKLLKGKSS